MKISNFFNLVYCINLDEREDRWEACQNEWYKLNHYPDRFSAIKSDHGPTGCYLSHLSLLSLATEKKSNILIFEDDVEFFDGAREILERALDELYGLDWDMAYLGGNILRPFFQKTEHWARLSHCQSTHAYAVNQNFVEQLYHIVEKNRITIDCLYADHVVPNFKAYIVVPMLAQQRTDYSDIEKKEMSYAIPLERYKKYLVRK